MKLSVKGLAFAFALLWGGCMLVMTVANLIWGNYGTEFLQVIASIYPGYHATRSFGEVIVGTLYGTVDGFFGGVITAWLYNAMVRSA